MTTDPENTIRCRDQCGATAPDQEAALRAGWSHLQITGGWRCGACAVAMYLARRIAGSDRQTVDTLPPISRGAIPRETASGITPKGAVAW